MSTGKTNSSLTIRPAADKDIAAIASCIDLFVKEGKVLPRALDELCEMIDQYIVAEHNDEIVGCVVLEIYSKKLCEIRSLAVSHKAQGMGIGKKLVQACVERARNEKILEVLAITSQEEFFQACGFDYTLPGEKKALFLLP
jgi:amino-acid N-acetyltransferase